MTPGQLRLGIEVFTGLVIASVGIALASLTWRLTGYSGVGPAVAPALANATDTTDLAAMLAQAPFGTAMAAGDASGGSAIRLKAIFMAIPASASSVLVAGSDGKVASYGIGAAVGGGVIESIATEQIVLRTPAGQQLIGFAPAAGPALIGGGIAGGSSGFGPAPMGGRKPLAPAGADAIRALIPESARGMAAPAPLATLGDSGYKVGPATPPILLAAGLRPGDLVEQVNGTPLSAGMNPSDLLTRAAQSGRAQVVVLRNGQRVSLTLAIR